MSQHSTLAADGIQAELAHRLRAGGGGVTEWLLGESLLSVRFELDAASAFELAVRVQREAPFGNPGGNSTPLGLRYHAVLSVALVGEAGSVFAFDDHVDCTNPFDFSCDPLDVDVVEAGVLEPGVYTLDVRSFSEVQGFLLCSQFS